MRMLRICCARRPRRPRLRSSSWWNRRSRRSLSRRWEGTRMLRNTLLIAKREYLERIRSKVFRITTVLVPVGMAGVAILGGIGGKKMEAGVQNLAVVSNNAELAQQVKAALGNGEHAPKSIEVVTQPTDADIAHLNQQVSDHDIGGYLKIDDEAGQTTPVATWVSGSSTDFIGKSQMESAVTDGLVREQLLQRGMTDGQVKTLMKDVKLNTQQVKNGKAVTSDAERSFAGAYALILELYGSVLIYGINIARSVVEEKTSRVFEVLLSTASADSLMLGKLLGVGATGLTQMAIWASLLVFYAGSAMAATLGSSVSGEQEVQQFSFILISPLVVSVVLLPFVLGNPNSTAAIVLSL